MAPEELNTFLVEQDAALVGFSSCPGCLRDQSNKERLLLLGIPWTLEGRDYSKTATFVCCEDIDERQLIKNMIYMLRELRKEIV